MLLYISNDNQLSASVKRQPANQYILDTYGDVRKLKPMNCYIHGYKKMLDRNVNYKFPEN